MYAYFFTYVQIRPILCSFFRTCPDLRAFVTTYTGMLSYLRHYALIKVHFRTKPSISGYSALCRCLPVFVLLCLVIVRFVAYTGHIGQCPPLCGDVGPFDVCATMAAYAYVFRPIYS